MSIDNTTRIQLDRPALAVWREPGVLQIGLDAPAVILDGVPPGLAEAVALLAQPCTADELTALLPRLEPRWLSWLIGCLAEHRMLVPTPTPTPAAASVLVVGTGPLAEEVSACLAAAGLGVDQLDPVGFVALPPRPDQPELTVLAATCAEPDRALTDALFREGRAHLVVRIEPDRAVVGPLVQPGRTPCVRCSDFLRAHLDPAWPHLLAQLCREQVEPLPTLRAWAAATAASQVAAWRCGAAPDTCGASLELGLPDYRLRRRAWPTHPACGCLLTPG